MPTNSQKKTMCKKVKNMLVQYIFGYANIKAFSLVIFYQSNIIIFGGGATNSTKNFAFFTKNRGEFN